jgi:hypothetical protein
MVKGTALPLPRPDAGLLAGTAFGGSSRFCVLLGVRLMALRLALVLGALGVLDGGLTGLHAFSFASMLLGFLRLLSAGLPVRFRRHVAWIRPRRSDRRGCARGCESQRDEAGNGELAGRKVMALLLPHRSASRIPTVSCARARLRSQWESARVRLASLVDMPRNRFADRYARFCATLARSSLGKRV